MPVIAVSLETFSGGEALAQGVAERLGYQCVSQQALFEATRKYGIPVDDLKTALKTPPSLLERAIGLAPRWPVGFVQALLCEQALNANLVYHGHVGHLLLPRISHVIRVLVIADAESRTKAAMQLQNLGRKERLAYIRKMDHERRECVRYQFDIKRDDPHLYENEWDDPHLYDVVVTLSRMGLQTACETVIQLAERDEFKPTSQSLQAMQDLALASRVAVKLSTNSATKEANLRVVAVDGIVTITGITMSPSVLEGVPVVARQVNRVKGVRSEVALASAPYDPNA